MDDWNDIKVLPEGVVCCPANDWQSIPLESCKKCKYFGGFDDFRRTWIRCTYPIPKKR